MPEPRLGRALLAEGIGTFVIVFVGCGAIAIGSRSGGTPALVVAAAFGLAVMVMIHTLGHVSGAHFNPAVTAAFAASGHLPLARVLPYASAQVAGAVLGVVSLRIILGDDVDLGVTRPAGSTGQAFAWEVGLTLILMLVIAVVATGHRVSGRVAAITIGATVAICAVVGGPVSGASMNPARSLGPALVAGDLEDLWIYLVAPVVGAIVAAYGYERFRRRRAASVSSTS